MQYHRGAAGRLPGGFDTFDQALGIGRRLAIDHTVDLDHPKMPGLLSLIARHHQQCKAHQRRHSQQQRQPGETKEQLPAPTAPLLDEYALDPSVHALDLGKALALPQYFGAVAGRFSRPAAAGRSNRPAAAARSNRPVAAGFSRPAAAGRFSRPAAAALVRPTTAGCRRSLAAGRRHLPLGPGVILGGIRHPTTPCKPGDNQE